MVSWSDQAHVLEAQQMQWRHFTFLVFFFPPNALASCRQRTKRIPVTAVRAKASVLCLVSPQPLGNMLGVLITAHCWRTRSTRGMILHVIWMMCDGALSLCCIHQHCISLLLSFSWAAGAQNTHLAVHNGRPVHSWSLMHNAISVLRLDSPLPTRTSALHAFSASLHLSLSLLSLVMTSKVPSILLLCLSLCEPFRCLPIPCISFIVLRGEQLIPCLCC